MRILMMMLLPIGDTLFATPAVHALRLRYPDARLTAVAYPTNAGILRNNPDVDEIVLWPTGDKWPGFGHVLRLFGGLRRSRYSLAVEFSNYNRWVSWLAGVPRREEMHLPRLWWVLPWVGLQWRKKHAVEHYADVVRRLNVPVDDLRLRVFPSEKESARAGEWLESQGVGPDELLVAMHPGGEGLWGRKRWGIDGFAEVALGLHARLGARIIIMGGKDEAQLASELAWRTRARVINAAGQTTLGETAALAARCALFIGNDSSPLHIAAASGTPVIGIYGPTDPRSYRPWVPGGKEGVDYAVVRSPLACAHKFPLVGGITVAQWLRILRCPALEAISAEQVLSAALGVLEASGRKKI